MFETALALEHLILIAADHIDWTVVGGYKFVVAPNLNTAGTIDVIDADISFRAADDAATVVETKGTRLEVGHLAIGKAEGNTFLHIHACRPQVAVADLPDDVGTEIHTGEVEGIDSEVEQGAATKVGTNDAWLLLHHVAEAGLKEAGLTDDAAFHT